MLIMSVYVIPLYLIIGLMINEGFPRYSSFSNELELIFNIILWPIVPVKRKLLTGSWV